MFKIIQGKSWVKQVVIFFICMSLWIFMPEDTHALESMKMIKQIIIVKNEKSEPIAGAVFEIKNEKNEVLETCISNEQGRIEIWKTNEGKYLLKQIKTKEGYELDKEHPIEIKIENPVREEVIFNKISSKEDSLIAETGQEIIIKNENVSQELEKNTTTNENENMNDKDEKGTIPEDEIKTTYGQAVTETAALEMDDIQINVTQNSGSTNKFTITTVGYSGKTGIGNVLFPTWTERNGQDDIHWYEGKLNDNGEYSVTVDNKDHGFETGTYNVHTYIYGLRGALLKTYTNIQKLEITTPTMNVTEVIGNNYKVQISGVSNPEGVMGVCFPTWTQINGQDDLRWETGKLIGNDTWEATIHINDYNKSYDTFITHAYIINKNGQLMHLESIEKKLTNPFLEEPLEIAVRQDSEVSKFVINTQNCANKMGIKGVSFAVWTNRNGQDEIKWYDGILGASGEYFALADVENHGFETGPYSVHTYLWGNGVEQIAIAQNAFTMPKITSTIEYDNAVINNTFKMRIKNVGNENGVAGITFPTWSRTNGQDDLRWEPAIYIGNHTWETSINLRNYNNIVDEFITNAYLVDKSGKCILAKDSVRRISQNTATIYGFYCYPLEKNYAPNPNDPTDWFGPRWGDIHEGIDIPANRYASCYSVGNGVVEKAGYFMGYGRYIRIRTIDRYGESVSFFYGHLQEINVSVGQSVSMGQKIGSVGGSGYNDQGKYIDDAYGSHLHFGAIVNADYACFDPEIWIDFHNPYSNV